MMNSTLESKENRHGLSVRYVGGPTALLEMGACGL